MWRSCLRLRDGGRRLLNRPRSGLTASEGLGRKPPIPFRAYVPPAERKKFYQNVSISQGEGGFEINLDHRKLRTPQGKLFTVPSEALAIAVATEWDSQQDTIKMYTMHLVTDHTVQHVSGQPHPAGQGPAHPGGREVLGHRHCLLQGGRTRDAGGAAEE